MVLPLEQPALHILKHLIVIIFYESRQYILVKVNEVYSSLKKSVLLVVTTFKNEVVPCPDLPC